MGFTLNITAELYFSSNYQTVKYVALRNYRIVGPTAVWERESFEISKFYSNIANIGSEDNVNMAGTDTVCNIGSQRGTFDTWTMLLQLV